MNKKIPTAAGAMIVLIVAVLAWVFLSQYQAGQPEVNPAVSSAKKKTVAQADNFSAQIKTLSTKWAPAGLPQWEKKELLNSGMVGVFPVDSKNFKITTAADQSSHYAELGNLIGRIDAPYVSDKQVFGGAQISTNQIIDGNTLESWINKVGVVIHQDYCQKYGTDDLRHPGNKTCITKISISKKVNDNVIFWNPDFIGSPDILSVLVGKTVVSFEIGQDISTGGNMDFEDFMQDMALTLTDNA